MRNQIESLMNLQIYEMWSRVVGILDYIMYAQAYQIFNDGTPRFDMIDNEKYIPCSVIITCGSIFGSQYFVACILLTLVFWE